MPLLWPEYNNLYLPQLTLDQAQLHKMGKLKLQSDRKSLGEFYFYQIL